MGLVNRDGHCKPRTAKGSMRACTPSPEKTAFDGLISSLGGAEEIIPEREGMSLGTSSVENQKEKGLERKIKKRKTQKKKA